MQKKRKYYRVGEKVYIKSLKKVGTVTALNIQPRTEDTNGTYEATIRFTIEGQQKEQTFMLWEINKVRTNDAKRKDTVLFSKVKENATIPSKIRENGCYDVYACFAEDMLVIPSHQVRLIPTGIASSFSSKYRFNCKRERGSTGKFGLMVASGQIDSGYRGEWFIAMYNPTDKDIAIEKGIDNTEITEDFVRYPYTKAICQAALEFVPNVYVKEIPYEKLEKIPSVRGKGKIGSSGK